MQSFRVRAPQRRKKNCPKNNPFPVPIESQTGLPASNHKWFYYTAFITGKGVFVKHAGDMEQLYTMGFFGKGTLSRHTPNFASRQPAVRKREQHSGDKVAWKVMSRRRYLQHQLWSQKEHRVWTTADSHSSQEIDVLPVPRARKTIGENFPHKQGEVVGDECEPMLSESDGDLSGLRKTKEDISKVKYPDSPCSGGDELAEPLIKRSRSEPGPQSHTEKYQSLKEHQFPPSSVGGSQISLPEVKGQDDRLEVKGQDDWTEVKGQDDWTEVKSRDDWPVYKPDYDPWADTTQEETTAAWGESENKCSPDKNENKCSPDKSHGINLSGQNIPVLGQILLDTKRNEAQEMKRLQDKATKDNSNSSLALPLNHSGSNPDALDVDFEDHLKSQEILADKSHPSPPNDTMVSGESVEEQLLIEDLDDRCLSNEEGGDLLVVDDTDDSDTDIAMTTRKPWKPVVKKDPWKVREMLQLSNEETFFLTYALGCLVVYDESGVPVDISGLWTRFCDNDPRFIARYAVYHNFRSKGWVPKSGLKYGSDFVIYKQGPAQYHSTYSVIVKSVRDNDLTEDDDDARRVNSWTSLAAINRTTEQVSKDLMFCYIIEPASLNTDQKLSPKCLSQLRIQEVVVRRWMSKQERENTEHVLIP